MGLEVGVEFILIGAGAEALGVEVEGDLEEAEEDSEGLAVGLLEAVEQVEAGELDRGERDDV